MVKDWKEPPDCLEGFVEFMNLPLEQRASVGMRGLLRRANAEYWPWHVLRHKPMPEGVRPTAAWGAVKAMRMSTREFPLCDVRGRHFGYWIPPAGQEHLHYLDRYFGGMRETQHPGALQANRDQYLIYSLTEEAISSSLLEGAATTRREAKEMLRTERPPRNRDERMVLNNYMTIQRIKEVKDKPLSRDLIFELHASMTRDTLDDPAQCGRFRTAEDHVTVEDPTTGEVLHVPPPAPELPARMEELCKFANEDDSTEFIHPIIRAILLHFWLGYDHPFVDGNGRTARALFYWYLLRKGYWLVEFLSISHAIISAPLQYTRAFIWSERDDQDATYFVMFHLRKLRQAAAELERYLERKQRELRESEFALATIEGLNHRQRVLLQHALRHPDGRYTIRYHRNCHGVAYPTARADLLDLSSRGLMQRSKQGRQFVFVPATDLADKLGVAD